MRNFLRINHEIRSPRIFLIDEEGKPLGNLELQEALKIAGERNYDLVEVGPQASPPVCKLLDYNKYRYQQEKKEGKNRHKLKSQELKEVHLTLKIEEHDWQVKLKKAREFLDKGHKVRLVLRVFGREAIFKERIDQQIARFKESLNAEIEQGPVRLGNRFVVLLGKKNTSNAKN